MSSSLQLPPGRLVRRVCRRCQRPARQILRSYSSFQSVASFGGFKAAKAEGPTSIPRSPAVTRFAPSPTGYLHLGSLRTALYSYLLARRTGGTFILRIEDTDRARTVADAEEKLYEALDWAGIQWDEGPDKPGPHGPYRQSERLPHYHSTAQQMLSSGAAYRCFCSSHSLEEHKLQSLDTGGAARYPGTCRGISPNESDQRAQSGEAHVIRFKAPRGARPTFNDLVYGRYAKQEDEDDFVLIKTDGFPTYHFANVVDDHLMKVTHVIRGVEWLISTPKHIALYTALGWAPPTFAHAPLLALPDGAKLSKRDRAVDLSVYRDTLVLPSALNNWAALLGCQMRKRDNSEVFTSMEELVENFSMKFTKGNVVINPKKMIVFQTAHVKALVEGEPATREHLLLQPLHDKILALETARQSALANSNSRFFLAKGDPRELDAAKLGHLVPSLCATSSEPSSARTQPSFSPALPYLQRILATNDTRYPDGVSILHDHPHLFWAVSPAAYHSGLIALVAAPNAKHQSIHHSLAKAIIDHLVAHLQAVPLQGWDSDGIANSLTTALETRPKIEAQSEAEAGEEEAKAAARDATQAVWSVLRLAMVGSPTTPTKPAKVLLWLLGKEEALRRFEALRKVIEEMEVSR